MRVSRMTFTQAAGAGAWLSCMDWKSFDHKHCILSQVYFLIKKKKIVRKKRNVITKPHSNKDQHQGTRVNVLLRAGK